MKSTGIAIVVIILIPVLFQVVILSIKQDRRNKQIQEILRKIESKLDK